MLSFFFLVEFLSLGIFSLTVQTVHYIKAGMGTEALACNPSIGEGDLRGSGVKVILDHTVSLGSA